MIQGVSGDRWHIKVPQSSVCAVAGSTVVIPCSFTHPPNVTVKKVLWTISNRSDEDLLENPEYMSRAQHNGDMMNNCTLTLRDVDLSDSRVYYVRILTDEQEVYPLPTEPIGVTLLVTDLSVEGAGPVVEGEEARLRCKHSCGFDDNNPTVTWTKNGQGVLTRQTDNSDLVLQNIRIEDEGYYSCALTDDERHPSKEVMLRVMYAPRNTSALVSQSNEIVEGSLVRLNCSSDANPPVESYTWFKKIGVTITQLATGQVYTIPKVSSKHTGYYYCKAKNQYGTSNSSDVYLNVQYAPRNTSALLVSPSGEIVEGSSVRLTCSSVANPPVESYTWFKKTGVSITQLVTEQVSTIPNPSVESYNWLNVDETTTLPMTTVSIYNISNISFEQTGYYYCQADNKHGANNSSVIHLEVFYAPKNIAASISPQDDIREGSSVNLTCSSDANPPVESYTWYKSGTVPSRIGSGQELRIIDLNSDHSGRYYCEGQNSFGFNRSREVYLEVQFLPWQNIAVVVAMGSVPLTVIVLYCLIYKGVKKCSKHAHTLATVHGVYEEVPALLQATSVPAQTVDSGDQDDVQYASVQFKRSGVQQVPLYSTAQKPKPHTQLQEEGEVEYAAVNFSRPTAATQRPANTVIYSKSTNRKMNSKRPRDSPPAPPSPAGV
ncbi:B-cell receptor CD22-like [Sardina pilchardus]|uniref:B-cell receptor CD22-like n=1 Tax=Sardina pilchardus TaxID=27697 RepID=UPI002E0D0F64